MYKFLCLLFVPCSAFAAAVDVTAVSQEVLDQISAVVMVGTSCLAIYWAIRAFSHVRDALGFGSHRSDQDDFWAKYNSGEAVEGVDFFNVDSGVVDVAGAIASDPLKFAELQAEADAIEARELAADAARDAVRNSEIRMPTLGSGWH